MKKPFQHKKSGGWKKPFVKGNFGDKPELHDAVCAKCGNACRVPFKPNGRKPIYCNNCFVRDADEGPIIVDRQSSSKQRFQRDFSSETGISRQIQSESSNYVSAELKKINTKLDMILRAIESDSDKGERE